MVLRRFFSTAPKQPRGPEGWRAYVIGDVHGCLAQMAELLGKIRTDHKNSPPADGLLVFVGDLIDRGPASAEVIERVRTLALPGFRVVTLAGNHEDTLLRILEGEAARIDDWLSYGGVETLQSYGLDPQQIAVMPPSQAQERIAAAVPDTHRRFLDELADTFRFGDYLFVHAGIRPGVPLEEQSTTDLRWIREPFLSDTRYHGMVVVHGHTISEEVEERENRIGIDTGAFSSGRLTALVIDGAERRFLQTEPHFQPQERLYG